MVFAPANAAEYEFVERFGITSPQRFIWKFDKVRYVRYRFG